MSLLKRGASDNEPDQGGSNEELYERLFPKIGRDFVHRDDLEQMLRLIMLVIDPLGLSPVHIGSQVEATKKALEYKLLLEAGKDGSDIYKDLIDLDDE